MNQDFTGAWEVDAQHSRFGFSVRHAMVTKIRGEFGKFEGKAHIAEPGLGDSKVDIVIDVDSIETRNSDRDNHLKGEDFFNVEQHPTITFSSTTIDEIDEGAFIVTGNLTICGRTRAISIPLELTGINEDSFGNVRAGLEGNRRINRKDWGLKWNQTLDNGGVMIADRITLEFDLSLVKLGDAAPSEEN
ncbi:MAG: YceI family protein [Rothia sp. (in: high G+C Gram-positive bacteria)]|nr:YceI family protein [Rothia sp. (in: high G+C Gram-positive bacteria)]